jgi:DNA polymerase-3 subunit beta
MKIQLKPETLKALLTIAAKKDIRYYLQGVLVEVNPSGQTVLVATDGHRLLALPVAADDVADPLPGEYIIPRDALESVKPVKYGRATHPFELTIEQPAPTPDETRPGATITHPARFTLTGATTAAGAMIDGRYPDWRRVLPATASNEPGHYQPDYVADFGAVASLLTGKKSPCPIIHHNGTSGALVTGLGHDAVGVLMPMRVDDDTNHPGLPAWTARA